MNANEMADLMIQFDSGRIYEHAEEIATMLRQQQAENELLRKRFGEELDAHHSVLRKLKKLKKAQEETTKLVMSEHCTCYKLGYSPLNDYASVKQK